MVKSIIQFTIGTIFIFGLAMPTSAANSPDTGSPDTKGASLRQIVGVVLINHGKGYSMAHLDMGLKPGDRVLTMDRASAVVVQDDGCVVKLKDNSIFTFKSLSICQENEKSIKKVGPYYVRAIGSEAVTDVRPDVPEEILDNPSVGSTSNEAVETAEKNVVEAQGSSFFSQFSTTQIVVTGVAVGLGLAVAGGGGGGGAVSGQ